MVVTPVGSIPDVIVHGENGWLVPVRDPGALERELGRLLASVELRDRLGREAHRVAEARFSPECAAARLEQLVWEVTRGTSAPHVVSPRPDPTEGGPRSSPAERGPE